MEALRSGWLTMGPRTEALETALREFLGVEHAVATSSGTAALHLSCIAVGAEAGSSVGVPGLGPASCAGAVRAAGAEPVPYELSGIDPDPELILSEASTPRAVIVRHPLGFPARLAPLAEACRSRNVSLIEDCRDALGARLEGGAHLGAEGEVAILSFSAARQVPGNEGGAVLTSSAEIAERVRSLRSHAMTSGTWDRHRGHAETYDVVDVGFNYRIDEVRSALACAGLAYADETAASLRRRSSAFLELGRLPAGAVLERSSPIALPLLAESAAGVESLYEAVVAAGGRARTVDAPSDPSLTLTAELAAQLVVVQPS